MAQDDIPLRILDALQNIYDLSEDALDGYKGLEEVLIDIHDIVERIFDEEGDD